MRTIYQKGNKMLHIYTTNSKHLTTPVFEEFRFPLNQKTKEILLKTQKTLRYHKGCFEGKALGISSPQVGSRKRFFVMENLMKLKNDNKTYIDKTNDCQFILNPTIIDYSSEKIDQWEGCVSTPWAEALVERPCLITVKYFNHNGAKIIQDMSG